MTTYVLNVTALVAFDELNVEWLRQQVRDAMLTMFQQDVALELAELRVTPVATVTSYADGGVRTTLHAIDDNVTGDSGRNTYEAPTTVATYQRHRDLEDESDFLRPF
jgi:hypothetical protein